MTKATFLRLTSQCCFECYANKRRHTQYINRHVAFLTEPVPSIYLQLNVYFEKNDEGKLATFLCRSILLNTGMHVHFTASTATFCWQKKQATLVVQVDVSRITGVISKETLFNKRDKLLLFLHHGIPRLACRRIWSHQSRMRLRNSSHHGEFTQSLRLTVAN